MKNTKWTRSITLWILAVMVLVLLWNCVSEGRIPNIHQFAAIIAVVMNIALFVFHQKLSIIFNGIILLLATFLILQFTMDFTVNNLGFTISGATIQTPDMQMPMLGLLVLYLFINLHYLLDLYEYWKEKKALEK